MRHLLLIAFFCGVAHAATPKPDEAFQRLMDGNRRYVNGQLLHPNRDQERRDKSAIAQKPFAIVLGCSDSRVAPEILFDEGIGDLFVVRVAGNVAGPIELASIEYSALYLGSTLLFVLGHENCGAVTAVLGGQTKDIEPIAKLIAPAVKAAKGEGKALLQAAIEDNVRYVVAQLERSPVLAKLIEQKMFAVAGGYYDLTTGEVTVLEKP